MGVLQKTKSSQIVVVSWFHNLCLFQTAQSPLTCLSIHSPSPKGTLGKTTVKWQVCTVTRNCICRTSGGITSNRSSLLRKRDCGFLCCQGMSADRPTEGLSASTEAPLMQVLGVKWYIVIDHFCIKFASTLVGEKGFRNLHSCLIMIALISYEL